MDDLRTEIWDRLFQRREPQSFDAIARMLNVNLSTIQQAVDHDWFVVSNGLVAVAYNNR